MKRSWLDSCFWKVCFAFEAWRTVSRLKLLRMWSRRAPTPSSALTLAFTVGEEGSDGSDGSSSSVVVVVAVAVAVGGPSQNWTKYFLPLNTMKMQELIGIGTVVTALYVRKRYLNSSA